MHAAQSIIHIIFYGLVIFVINGAWFFYTILGLDSCTKCPIGKDSERIEILFSYLPSLAAVSGLSLFFTIIFSKIFRRKFNSWFLNKTAITLTLFGAILSAQVSLLFSNVKCGTGCVPLSFLTTILYELSFSLIAFSGLLFLLFAGIVVIRFCKK